MTLLDWGQVIFLSLVVIIGIGGMVKVIFLDKDK